MKSLNQTEVKLRNIKDLLETTTARNKNKVAFFEKKNGALVGYTYGELKRDVDAFGTKLLQMGLKDNHFCIIGENSYMWVVAYLSIINGVGVAVPLDRELPKEQISNLVNKSDASVLIFSNTYLNDIEDINRKCPNLEYCISFDKNNLNYLDAPSLIGEGNQLILEGNNQYLNMNIDNDILAVLIFTSGTTGPNKGVMLSHSNIIAVAKIATNYFKGYKTLISVLPIHHIYENAFGLLTALNLGMTIFFNDSLKYLTKNMKEFKPDLMLVVPLFLETMYKKIWIEVEKLGLSKTLKYSIKVSNILYKFGIDIRRLWYKKVLDQFGGSLRTIVCGGAYLRPELVANFREIGIDVINGYGITECSPLVSVNIGKKTRDNSVGYVIPCSEVMIYEPNDDGIGEILVKGPNVMLGYYKDSQSNSQSFYNEWFRTGDYGYMYQEGSLIITGRKKNLIILGNGKNVHPEEIEGYILSNMPYVLEVVVHANEKNDTILATAYVDKEYLEKNNITNLQQQINQDLKIVNSYLPAYKQVHHVNVRHEEFEKNTSKKIVRHKFLEGVSSDGR